MVAPVYTARSVSGMAASGSAAPSRRLQARALTGAWWMNRGGSPASASGLGCRVLTTSRAQGAGAPRMRLIRGASAAAA